MRKLVTYHSHHYGSKPEVVLCNAGSCIRPLSIDLLWNLNDDNICKNSYHRFRSLSAILYIEKKILSDRK